MKKQLKSNFREKVTTDVKRQQSRVNSYGYLNIPKGIRVISIEPNEKIKLDFLPYVVSDPKHPDRNPEKDVAMPGTLWYKRPFKIHRNIGAANETVVCPTLVGKRCPICEYRAKLMKGGVSKENIDALKPSLRNLYIVVPIDHPQLESVPHILDISQYLFQDLLNKELEENEDFAVFPDLEEGLSLRIRFEGRIIGKSQPFPEASRIDFFEREHSYSEDILKEIPDLDKVLNILSYEELESKFTEIDIEESNEKLKDLNSEVEKAPVKREVFHRNPIKETLKEKEIEIDEDKPIEKKEDEGRQVKKSSFIKERKENIVRSSEKCLYGHRFGIDNSDYEECEKCEIWDSCYDERKNL
jgi:hypothetical protein